MEPVTKDTLHEDLERLLMHARIQAGERDNGTTRQKVVTDANRLLLLMDILTLDDETAKSLKAQYIDALKATAAKAEKELDNVIGKALNNSYTLNSNANMLWSNLDAMERKLTALSKLSINTEDPYCKAALLYERIIEIGTQNGVSAKDAALHASYIVWAVLQQGAGIQCLPDSLPSELKDALASNGA